MVEDSKSPAKPNLKAEHGLAYLIKAKIDDSRVKIMMDTGSTPEALLHNIDLMDINLGDVNMIFLSHGHYDHTGGLIVALKQSKKRVPVIGHPIVFEPKLKINPYLKFIGAPFSWSEVKEAGGIPLLSTDTVKIADGIITTGEIPRRTSFEKVKGFWTVQNGRFTEDLMLDDQSLIMDVENKGLVVVSGCGHSGIINSIKHAQYITGNSKIYAVLGGLHLINADTYRIQATASELRKVKPEFVGPCHCTGKKATAKIAETFGDSCHILHTGDSIKF
jgi:7,8-dihydropterin-6-yl-methyl-4-(beta-D-ribofuranosyl)aminobenzene 5'-phosphate synthase